jgi:hypothetical protein
LFIFIKFYIFSKFFGYHIINIFNNRPIYYNYLILLIRPIAKNIKYLFILIKFYIFSKFFEYHIINIFDNRYIYYNYLILLIRPIAKNIKYMINKKFVYFN